MVRRSIKQLADRSTASTAAEISLIAALVVASWLMGDLIGRPIRATLRPLEKAYDTWLGGWRGWLLIGVVVIATVIARVLRRRGQQRLAMAAAATAVVLVVCGVVAVFVLGADDIAVFLASVLVVAAGAWVAARLLDALLFALDPVVVRPVAWAHRRERPGQPIRWAGFMLVLVGQLIDLLAS